MTCKERILSNDYADILGDVILTGDYEFDLPFDYCFHQITQDLGVLYIERRSTESYPMGQRAYSLTPKCYGLMECGKQPMLRAAQDSSLNTLSLAESGILIVQGEPLNLTGKNVTNGFMATGIL